MAKGKWLDDKQIRKMEDDIWEKCLILSTAYLMDEMDYDKDKIQDYYDSMTRYLEGIKDHLITVENVKNIIKDHIKAEVRIKK